MSKKKMGGRAMPHIWRVEDSNEVGFYYSDCRDGVCEKIWQAHNKQENLDNYPTPQEDKGIGRYPELKEICGFKDKTQAMTWFNKAELHAIQKTDIKLKRIKVKQITARGMTQVLAIR